MSIARGVDGVCNFEQRPAGDQEGRPTKRLRKNALSPRRIYLNITTLTQMTQRPMIDVDEARCEQRNLHLHTLCTASQACKELSTFRVFCLAIAEDL